MDADQFYDTFIPKIEGLTESSVHAFSGQTQAVLIEGPVSPQIEKLCEAEGISAISVEEAFIDGRWHGWGERWYWSADESLIFQFDETGDYSFNPTESRDSVLRDVASHPERAQRMFPHSLKEALGIPELFYMSEKGQPPNEFFVFFDRRGETLVDISHGNFETTEIMFLPAEKTFIRVERSSRQGDVDYVAREVGSAELWKLADALGSGELERAARIARAFDH